MKKTRTVGIVGAGTMGSAIAQKFAQEGFMVILVDRSMEQVQKGIAGISSMLNQGVERKVFTEEQVKKVLGSIKGSSDIKDLAPCQLVIEAIYENFNAKCELFKALSSAVKKNTIVATNTSSFSVTELSAHISHPERFIGMHFFYHAAKNRLLEIIPGEKTSPAVMETAKQFALLAGKDAIICVDAYGFAVNRFFVPWLNEAVRLHEEGIATKEEIDTVCMDVFGIGMGPFALMNATGVPVAFHSEKTLEIFGELYKVAGLLEEQANKNEQWPLGAIPATVPSAVAKKIADRMLSVVFFVCSQVLDENVCSAADLNRGARIGLRWRKGPVELMIAKGEREVKKLVQATAALYHMQLPQSVGDKYWTMETVLLTKYGRNVVITMAQPESMNALTEETMQQLYKKFTIADSDPAVRNIFITGQGKAFVAGADIRFFTSNMKNNTIDNIVKFTRFGQKVFERIDSSKKKVIAVLNGLTLGGGLELALCADLIIATPKASMAFPETGIGIYPGLGGTQRSSRRIGKTLSKYLIHTGKMIGAAEAEEIGLADAVVDPLEAMKIMSGERPLPTKVKVKLPKKWKSISSFFRTNSLDQILEGTYSDKQLTKEEAEKVRKAVSTKAPIALKLAEKLIAEEKGCASELRHLRKIFSTSDAMLGLSSIGKKVQYEGR